MEPLSSAFRPACRHNLFGKGILTSVVYSLHNALVEIGSGTGARMTPMMGSSGVWLCPTLLGVKAMLRGYIYFAVPDLSGTLVWLS